MSAHKAWRGVASRGIEPVSVSAASLEDLRLRRVGVALNSTGDTVV